MSFNNFKFAYLNAKFIHYDPASTVESFGDEGSQLVFQTNSVEFSSEGLFPAEFFNNSAFSRSSEKFYSNLISSDFVLDSFEGSPSHSNLDIDRIYINLNHVSESPCINSNNPLDALMFPKPSITGDRIINGTQYQCSKREYEGIIYYGHSYKIANSKKIDTDWKDSDFSSNELYISYRKCAIASFRFKASYTSDQAFYKNLIFIEDEERYYVENFDKNFYYDTIDQKYYLNQEKEELGIEICTDFFPTLVLNKGSVIHGEVRGELKKPTDSDLNINLLPLWDNVYADICYREPCAAPLNTIICCPFIDGLASINYNGTHYLLPDQLICPIGESAKAVMVIIRLAHVDPLIFYKSFSAQIVNVNIYAYNFKNIDYVDVNQNYTPFKSNESIQIATMIYENEPLPLSNFFDIKIKNREVISLTFRFKAYKILTSDSDATDYFFDIPIRVRVPEIKNIQRNGNNILFTTNYGTRINYQWQSSEKIHSQASVFITDTESGENQKTAIDISNLSGNVFFTVYNYFSEFSNKYSVSKSINVIKSTIFSYFTFQLYKNGSASSVRDFNGDSLSQIHIVNCAQNSFGSYSATLDYLDIDCGFKLSFSMPDGYSEVWLRIGRLDPKKITSGEITVISRELLSQQLNSEGYIQIIASLQNEIPFIIPFTFFKCSTLPPNIGITQQLTSIFNGADLTTKFSFNYQYANRIEYKIINELGNILYGPILEKVAYSTSLTEKAVLINNTLTCSGWVSITGIASAINRSHNYPYNEVEVQVLTNSFANNFKTLNKANPAEIKFYSDVNKINLITRTNKGETIYAFLQLYKFNGDEILVEDYSNYINIPEFKLIESPDDENDDLKGVTNLTKVNNYFCSFVINAGDLFNDLNLILEASFEVVAQYED